MKDILNSKQVFPIIYFVIIFEILTPIIFQNGILPEEIRWLSHVLNALLIAIFLIQIIRNKVKIVPVLIFFAVICLSTVVALTNHQSKIATIWGIWIFARYPLIGFLVSSLEFSKKQGIGLFFLLITIPILELVIQLVQFISGISSWDNLGGSFGVHGTGMLLLTLILCLVYFLGKWINERKAFWLFLVISMGMFSSVLGEMKMYYFSLIMLGLFAVVIFIIKNKMSTGLIIGMIGVIFVIFLFPKVIDKVYYNKTNSLSFMQQITDISFINKYVGFVGIDRSGNYDVGRNYAIKYVWGVISSNNTRFTFGDGLGSRGESRALGSAGVQLLSGNLGLFTGSSLVVFLGEMGILSLLYLAIFMIFTVVRCIRLIRSNQVSYLVSLGYAVLIFSLFWPIWLWYNTAWTLPGSMPLYWMMWGVVVHYSTKKTIVQKVENGR